MNFMVTKLSPRRLIFLFAYLFVLYFQTADLYSNEAALLARPMPMEYLYFAYYKQIVSRLNICFNFRT